MVASVCMLIGIKNITSVFFSVLVEHLCTSASKSAYHMTISVLYIYIQTGVIWKYRGPCLWFFRSKGAQKTTTYINVKWFLQTLKYPKIYGTSRLVYIGSLIKNETANNSRSSNVKQWKSRCKINSQFVWY